MPDAPRSKTAQPAPAALKTPPAGKRSIRTGLVGYGFAGKTFHAPLIDAVPRLELAAVSSRNAEKVHADFPEVTVFPTPEALFADPSLDLVVIATPNDTHAPLARAALRAGKNVVVDKPFTLDLDEGRALIREAEEAGRLLSVFHNRRWDSDYLSVKHAIESGLVGEVAEVESRIDRFRPHVRDRWRERAVPGGGIWFDLGPHLIDQALQLFGLPDRVLGSLATQRPGAQVDDWAQIILAYGEKRVLLHASMLVAGGSARFTVHGTKGSLVKRRADQQEAQLLAGVRPGAPGWGQDSDPLVFYDGETERVIPTEAGDQRKFYEGVAAALGAEHAPALGQATLGQPALVRPLEALAVMAVLQAGTDSAREGRALPLPLTEKERAAWSTTV